MNSTQKENASDRIVLVLGATGKTGSRVAARLAKQHVNIRPGSRSASLPFDWEDKTTWDAALDKVHSVYISYHPDVAAPGAPEVIDAFVKAAAKKGIKKLVLLSGRGEPEAQQCEQIVIKSGIDWTVIRASWFSQNFSEGFLLDAVLEGFVALPVGNIPDPFIDIDDIADVAVAALTDDKHIGKLYEVTGPTLLTFEQAVQEISNATGRKIGFMKIPMDDYVAAMTEHGVPKYIIDLVSYLFSVVLDGRNASVQNGVFEAIGRKPGDFATYAKKVAEAGGWKK